MLERLKNIRFFDSSTFGVVGLVIGDVVTYNVLIIKRDNDRLNVSRRITTEDFDEVVKFIDKKMPVLINFSGKGVVSKKSKASSNSFKDLVFNSSVDDFNIYSYFEDRVRFVSIARKEIINEYFALFEKVSLFPVDFSIGPFVGCLVEKMVEYDTEIVVNSTELKFEQGKLIDFSKSETKARDYKIGNDTFQCSEIVLVATLLQFLYPSEKIDYEKDLLSENFKEQKLKKAFDLLSVCLMGAIFSALVASYLLLNYFNHKYVEYEKQMYHFNDSYHQVKKIKEELENKKFLVENAGILNRNFLSYYINEISNTVPREIVLEVLEVNPVVKKIKYNEEVFIETQVIVIEGKALKSASVSSWVKKLRKTSWVNKIEIVQLNQNNKDNRESFTLRIHIV